MFYFFFIFKYFCAYLLCTNTSFGDTVHWKLRRTLHSRPKYNLSSSLPSLYYLRTSYTPLLYMNIVILSYTTICWHYASHIVAMYIIGHVIVLYTRVCVLSADDRDVLTLKMLNCFNIILWHYKGIIYTVHGKKRKKNVVFDTSFIFNDFDLWLHTYTIYTIHSDTKLDLLLNYNIPSNVR